MKTIHQGKELSTADASASGRFRAFVLPSSRRHMEPLCLLACLFLVAVTFSALLFTAYVRADTPGYDFRYYWLAGKIWASGVSPYGPGFYEAGQKLIAEGHVPTIWPYPPNMWLPSVWFAMFDLRTAWHVLLGLQLLAVPAASWIVAYALPADKLPGLGHGSVRLTRFGVFLLHMAFVAPLEATLMTVHPGQISMFVYLAVVLILCGLVRQRQWLIVAGLVVVFLKPQIGAIMALAFMMSGRNGLRAVLSAALISLLLVVPAMIVKPDVIFDWLHSVASYDGASQANLPIAMSGIRNLIWVFAEVDIGTFAAMGVTGAASIAVTVYLRRSAGFASQPEQAALFDLVVAQSLVIMAFAPLHLYDFTLLGVACLAAAGATGVRMITICIVTAMTMHPSVLYHIMGGEFFGIIFPGSTTATIGVIILLIVLLTREPFGRHYPSTRLVA